jgi:hypothetical protein
MPTAMTTQNALHVLLCYVKAETNTRKGCVSSYQGNGLWRISRMPLQSRPAPLPAREGLGFESALLEEVSVVCRQSLVPVDLA